MAQFELRASKYPKNRCCYLCSILHKERDILTIEVGFINGIAAGWLIYGKVPQECYAIVEYLLG